jgi:hypothetical protein
MIAKKATIIRKSLYDMRSDPDVTSEVAVVYVYYYNAPRLTTILSSLIL